MRAFAYGCLLAIVAVCVGCSNKREADVRAAVAPGAEVVLYLAVDELRQSDFQKTLELDAGAPAVSLAMAQVEALTGLTRDAVSEVMLSFSDFKAVVEGRFEEAGVCGALQLSEHLSMSQLEELLLQANNPQLSRTLRHDVVVGTDVLLVQHRLNGAWWALSLWQEPGGTLFFFGQPSLVEQALLRVHDHQYHLPSSIAKARGLLAENAQLWCVVLPGESVQYEGEGASGGFSDDGLYGIRASELLPDLRHAGASVGFEEAANLEFVFSMNDSDASARVAQWLSAIREAMWLSADARGEGRLFWQKSAVVANGQSAIFRVSLSPEDYRSVEAMARSHGVPQ